MNRFFLPISQTDKQQVSVAQTPILSGPCRRMAFGRRPPTVSRPLTQGVAKRRLEVCDTAECHSALPGWRLSVVHSSVAAVRLQSWCSLLTALLVTSCTLSAADPASTPEDITFIDNGQIRIGVKKSSGCGIAWFSSGSGGRNLVNHWDRGRL
ncbi:MAG TPA: hypothetical protein VLD18_03665, partial [Verrucomicrobiae bacterium]|nr:hypothetical protein [Verrucomicrobiae bacterium]